MSNLKAVPNGFITPVTIEDKADRLTVKDIKKAQKKKIVPPKTTKKAPPNKKYDENFHPQEAISYLALGFPIRTLSYHFSISSSTLQDWRKTYPEFEVACQEGRKATEKFYVQLALDLAEGKKKGNVASLIFLMKNVCGYRDNPEEKQDSKPITINFGIAKPAEPTE